MSNIQNDIQKSITHSFLLDMLSIPFAAFTIYLVIVGLFSDGLPFSFRTTVCLVLVWGCWAASNLYIALTTADRLQKQRKLLAEHEKLLMEAEKESMRANLLRAVSHDLRTPLTGIIGNCIVYLENKDRLSDVEKENLVHFVYDESTWLINMVENLLTVTRIQDKGLCINLREESVEEIIGESLMKIEKRHPEVQITVTVPDELLLIPMDALLIEQVTINLIENAIFHSGTAKPIELLVENRENEVAFSIKDFGTGIPEDKLVHLFEGSDYNTPSSDSGKGIGIGLVICKTIIQAHNGIIIGRNHSGGAEFIFTLPKKKPD